MAGEVMRLLPKLRPLIRPARLPASRQVKHVRHGHTETRLGQNGKAAINRPYDQGRTLVYPDSEKICAPLYANRLIYDSLFP
jgi:hypothetical protein